MVNVKSSAAMVSVTQTKEKTAIIAGMIVLAGLMKDAIGENAIPIVVMAYAKVMKIAGIVEAIALVQVMSNANTLANVKLTAGMEDASLMRIARPATIAVVSLMKTVSPVRRGLIPGVVLAYVAMESSTGARTARPALRMLVARKGCTAIIMSVSSVLKTAIVNQEKFRRESLYVPRISKARWKK